MASTPVRRPCGTARPNSRQKPRKALIREVRVLIHRERVRCKTLQGLLLDRFHAHRNNLGAARGFKQGHGVGGIGLVALHVGTDVGRRQQFDLDATGD